MDFDLTARQKTLVANAKALARDVLARNAGRYDALAVPPADDYDALISAGYHGMLIPEAYGGWGLDLVTYCLVMHELAQGAGATSTAFNMHNFAMWNIQILGTEEQKRHWFSKILTENCLMGGWGSEPGAGLSQGRFAIGTTIAEQDDGYRVNGRKFFCTLAGVAKYAEVLVHVGDAGAEVTVADICTMIVPVDAPGVAIGSDWDVLGMRATVSPAVELNDVVVPKDHMLGRPGDNIMTRHLAQAISIGYAGIYCGVARAALDFAVDYAARKPVGGGSHADQPIVQNRIGELATTLDAAYALALKAAWEMDNDFHAGALDNTGSRARAVAMRSVLDVTSKAFEICGGTTVAKRFPAERYYREARTMTLMNPGYDGILGMAGKAVVDQWRATNKPSKD